jgi:hypothetical protein
MERLPGVSSPPSGRAQVVRQYLAVAAVFAVLAAVLAFGWTGWAPITWYDWLTVAGLTPAGVGGVLLGDRVGLWLKDRGFGRQ